MFPYMIIPREHKRPYKRYNAILRHMIIFRF
nr:MAG TPA: hypothetical protein [Caudoviricetes sp.]